MIRRLLAVSAMTLGLLVASATPASADDAWCIAIDPVLGMCQGTPGIIKVLDDLL